MKLDFKTVKLKSFITKVNKKVKAFPANNLDLTVYGVSKNEGVCITGKEASADLSEYIVIEGNTFAYNPYRVNIGSIGLTPERFNGVVSPAYVVFKTKTNLNSEFLFHYLKSDIGLKLINWYGNRGGVRNALRYDALEEIDIPDIDLSHQLKALHILKSYGSQIENIIIELNHQEHLITQLRQSILQEAVQGKLVPQNPKDEPASVLLEKIRAEKQKLIKEGKLKKEKELPPITKEEIPFELPKGWVWCRFQEISKVDSGSTPDQKEFTQNPDDIPYLKVYNISKQKVAFEHKPQYIRRSCHEGQLKRSVCVAGNVIMNIVGPPLGKIAIIPSSIPECNINQAIVVFRPYNVDLSLWFYYYLCEMSAINSIVTKGTAGQDNISLTQARELIIALPPLQEQQRIVSKVEELMKLCDQLEQEVKQSKQLTEQLMQSVLREAFEGEKKEKKEAVNAV